MKNGPRRIAWAERSMPVLRVVRERFERERPLAGQRVAALKLKSLGVRIDELTAQQRRDLASWSDGA